MLIVLQLGISTLDFINWVQVKYMHVGSFHALVYTINPIFFYKLIQIFPE